MPREILAAAQIGFPLLSLVVALPLLAAAAIPFVRSEARARKLALAAAGLELALTALVVACFRPGTADLQLAERYPWIPTLGAEIHLGVDGLSVLFLPLTALLILLVLLASWSPAQGGRRGYLAALLALEGAMVGIFTALDLALLFVFWELMLVPTYFLVATFGVGPDRRRAAFKLMVFMLGGSAPLLLGFLLLALSHREALAAAGQPAAWTFDYLALLATPAPAHVQPAIFFLLLAAFAVKSPIFPLHTWLPQVIMDGPIGVAVMFTGIKVGAYGMLRLLLPLTPAASVAYLDLIAALAGIGVVYGALIALVQPNLRRMLVFSSLSHVGMVVLGVTSLKTQGLEGAVLQMVNMAFISGGLALVTGILHARTGSSEMAALGGVARRAPRLAATFFLVGAASIGVPGTGGFAGEHLILLGAFRANPWLAAVGLLGAVLGAAYFLNSFARTMLGPITQPAVADMEDLRPRERIVAAVLALGVLGVGLYPAPIVRLARPTLEALSQRVEMEARGPLSSRR